MKNWFGHKRRKKHKIIKIIKISFALSEFFVVSILLG